MLTWRKYSHTKEWKLWNKSKRKFFKENWYRKHPTRNLEKPWSLKFFTKLMNELNYGIDTGEEHSLRICQTNEDRKYTYTHIFSHLHLYKYIWYRSKGHRGKKWKMTAYERNLISYKKDQWINFWWVAEIFFRTKESGCSQSKHWPQLLNRVKKNKFMLDLMRVNGRL